MNVPAPAMTAYPASAVVLAGMLIGFAILAVVLTIVDVRTHRLPNRLVLSAYPAVILLVAVAAYFDADASALFRSLLGGAAAFALFFVLRAVSSGGLGGGDVKLAGVIGLVLAALGWDVLIVGIAAGFIAGGVFAVIVLLSRRGGRATRIAFGPWMLLGAWTSIVLHLLV